ncbi:MarR family winged helix-turn-helix transcriptional regulator [Humibacter ginsenosidimutans]|uniref:MarR family transcriptional regulator n=1 Tax=Humibacter ginsenosidimutans TaxID=2599293 RepID=A0A5B8M7S2_9MICO|nr:MarR family transcriptional regulator [Humibacter ginsenosidimutans]QDZ15652.1 MarR family transcriptional regulator [Humibacter ginsenosidimutans]
MTSAEPQRNDPRDVLGYLVKQAHLRLTARVDAALAPFGFDRRALGVLRVLIDDEPLSQQTVAGRLGVDPTTMVALIDGLEAAGTVTRTPDPSDRRRNAVALTAAGRDAYRTASAAFTAAEDEFLAPLSTQDAATFRRLLRILISDETATGTRP